MKAKPIRLCVLIIAIFLLLSVCVSVFYGIVRYNSEKQIQYITAYDRGTSFHYKAENADFKKNFFTINNSNYGEYKASSKYTYYASAEEIPESNNYIKVVFTRGTAFHVNGYISFDSFRKSMTDNQYDKICRYLNTEINDEQGSFYDLVCTYYLYKEPQIIPTVVEIVKTNKNHVWYLEDEVIETFKLNTNVDTESYTYDPKIHGVLFKGSDSSRNVIDRDFFFGRKSIDIINERINNSKSDSNYDNLYYLGNFEYAYRHVGRVYPSSEEIVDETLGQSFAVSSGVYNVTYIETFNVLDNCINDIILVATYTIILFLSVGCVLAAWVYFYMKKRHEHERNLITITNSLAHNLKTPLFVISGNAENLMEYKPDTIQQDYVKTIINQVDIMDERVRKMFELSRMESGVYKLNTESFNFSELIENIVVNYSGYGKEISLNLKENVYINADKSLMATVVENLIDNAVRYSEENSITISFDGKVFFVSNPCSYLSKKDIKRIFKPYYRHPENKQKQGNGIGLNIARKIIKLHKFKMQATIQKGVFTISVHLK